LIALILRPSIGSAARAAAEAGPFLLLGGGLMGVVMVAAMNFVFPRLPAFSATLLLFSGQALTGVLIDYLSQGILDVRKLIGTGAVVAGLALNAFLAAHGRRNRGK